jgi:hypothetical protein
LYDPNAVYHLHIFQRRFNIGVRCYCVSSQHTWQ